MHLQNIKSIKQKDIFIIFQIVIPWKFVTCSFNFFRSTVFELITQLSTGMINTFSIPVDQAWSVMTLQLHKIRNQQLHNVFFFSRHNEKFFFNLGITKNKRY